MKQKPYLLSYKVHIGVTLYAIVRPALSLRVEILFTGIISLTLLDITDAGYSGTTLTYSGTRDSTPSMTSAMSVIVCAYFSKW